jgi:outer membrane protein assembly factor BamA
MLLGQVRSAAQTVQEPGDAPPGSDQAAAPEKPDEAAAAKKRGEFAIAPIPIINPTIGNGIGVVGLYTLRLSPTDTVSPPSTFGAGGFRTSNGSWAFTGGGKLFLKRDRFRILAAGGTTRLNYNFYGIGNESGVADTAIPITQKASGFIVGGQMRIIERWFVGPQYYHFNVTTGPRDVNPENTRTDLSPIRDVQFRLPVAALGLHVQRDTTNSQTYPRSGSIFDTKLYFSDGNVGARFNYQDYGVSFQQYFPLGKSQVLAYRVKACAISGDAPFFALCTLGNASDMRGYPTGCYQDRRMLVGQAEYRLELPWRFGFAAFMGAGQVAPTFTDFNGSNTRPGGGVGVRYVLAPKNHINLRVDYSMGQNSHAWYVGVGEAF